MKRLLLATLSGVCLSLTACRVGPNYKRPAYTVPPAFRGADNTAIASDPATSIGDRRWSEIFRSPELQALVEQALANNYDLHIAAQRILEQQAQVQITRAQQFPQINVGGTGIGGRNIESASTEGGSSSSGSTSGSGGSTGTGTTVPANTSSPLLAFGLVELSAAWTPDFWGLYRRQTEAARATLLAQVWAQRAVRLTLVQDVVSTWLTLRGLDRQLAISRETVRVREQSVALTRTLEQGGANPLSDVRQAEELLYTATSEIPQLEQQIQQNENNMRLLLGANPGPVSHADPNALEPPPVAVPVGLPSQLLERRPDVQQAEAQLMAANANIGVARAQFFPQFSLSGVAGGEGLALSQFFTAGQTYYGVGTLAQPLFEGGKLRGQLKLAQQTDRELVFAYQQTIATALHDVSNALIAYTKQRAFREQQQKLVDASQDAVRLARMRFQGGATSYLEVLTTDTALYTAQLNLASAEESEALTLVQLYSALGGGWQP